MRPTNYFKQLPSLKKLLKTLTRQNSGNFLHPGISQDLFNKIVLGEIFITPRYQNDLNSVPVYERTYQINSKDIVLFRWDRVIQPSEIEKNFKITEMRVSNFIAIDAESDFSSYPRNDFYKMVRNVISEIHFISNGITYHLNTYWQPPVNSNGVIRTASGTYYVVLTNDTNNEAYYMSDSGFAEAQYFPIFFISERREDATLEKIYNTNILNGSPLPLTTNMLEGKTSYDVYNIIKEISSSSDGQGILFKEKYYSDTNPIIIKNYFRNFHLIPITNEQAFEQYEKPYSVKQLSERVNLKNNSFLLTWDNSSPKIIKKDNSSLHSALFLFNTRTIQKEELDILGETIQETFTIQGKLFEYISINGNASRSIDFLVGLQNLTITSRTRDLEINYIIKRDNDRLIDIYSLIRYRLGTVTNYYSKNINFCFCKLKYLCRPNKQRYVK